MQLLNDIQKAAHLITDQLDLRNRAKANVAIVLGSGLGSFAEQLKASPSSKSINYKDIPAFSPSTVDGHKGELIYSAIDEQHPVLVLNGRLHLYEGYEPQNVVLPLRTLKALGISTVILTNASGAIGENYQPGQLMVVKDHINFTGSSPLVGQNCAELGPRFVDMTEAYDKELINLAKHAATKTDVVMHEGIYGGMLGPCYETPAEVRMMRTLGADAVGMSTVFETIAARHMDMRVLAICCLTNKAAGLSNQKICHQEVMDINAKLGTTIGIILKDIVKSI